jgi:hypothetical protein
MSEKIKMLPLEKLLKTPGRLPDHMLNPLGGLALVETGVDAKPLITGLAPFAGPDEFYPDILHTWQTTVTRRPALRQSSTPISEVPAELRTRLHDLTAAVRQVIDPVQEAFGAPLGSQRLISHSRIKITENSTHVDDGPTLTEWFGATLPGLSILYKNAWCRADDVPTGHMLVWRAEGPYDRGLEPQVHRVQYRSKSTWRSILLGYDLGSSDFN